MKTLKYLKFSFPIHKETLESWIKLLDDVTKAALLAMLPLIWLESQSVWARVITAVVLAVVAYLAQVYSDWLRKFRDRLIRKD